MTAAALLAELQTRHVHLAVTGSRLRLEAPQGVLTPALRSAVRDYKPELIALLSAQGTNTPHVQGTVLPPTSNLSWHSNDLVDGTMVAVLLRATLIGDCWLVADQEALTEHPEILRSGIAVIFFDEVETLRGKTATELQALGLVKSIFPTARIVQ